MTYSPDTLIKREEIPTIGKKLDKVLRELRNCELELYSVNVQEKFEKEKDIVKKQKFLDERTDVTVCRVKLEGAILEKIAARLKCLEKDLNEGLAELAKAVADVENTVAILTTMKNVTGLVARILVLI
jgi:hypothetical protein